MGGGHRQPGLHRIRPVRRHFLLDASALLALLNQEPGWHRLASALVDDDATISAVNYAEVLQKAARVGVPAEAVDAQLDGLGVTVSPFGRLDARLAASLYRHQSGLSPTGFVWAWPAAWRARPTPLTASGKLGPTSSGSRWSSFGSRAP